MFISNNSLIINYNDMPSKYQFYSKGNIILSAQKLIYKMFLHNNDDKMDQIKQDVKIYYYD